VSGKRDGGDATPGEMSLVDIARARPPGNSSDVPGPRYSRPRMAKPPAKPTPARGPVRTRLTARHADRHVLYERSVQTVQAEIDFVMAQFRRLRRRRAIRLREDFCGTAGVCCEWVRRRPNHVAIGVDLDAPTLQWGKDHHLARLTPRQRARVRLVQADVRSPGPAGRGVDAVLAMNFSYWLLASRRELVRYFRSVRRSLGRDGLFFLDIYGGWEAGKVQKDRRPQRGFTYIWDQAKFDPITHMQTAHIHFNFKDGTRMRRAFTYTWRMWTIPEVRDALADAGFARSIVYWEGDNRKGGGNGVFTPAESAENYPAFIAYVVGVK
jgi:SAM-dependent methyltransferase